jgi:MinD-like ATPase involved in chromosome partitioning or flagellar assembly/CheY-like chemotaxis protein
MAEKKVLIVDGDGASRDFLARTLEKRQCRVLETSLGKEGLVFAWRDQPDLIVIDPKLADLSGEEIIRKLRADARTAVVPVIALSSDPSQERRTACLKSGFNEYLFKSVEIVPALMETLDRWLVADSSDSSSAGKEGGLLIVFLSAKGGTGTSSLCANLAMNIFRHEKDARVAVVDSVLPIGSIASIVGYDGQMNLITVTALPLEKTNAAFFRESLPEPPAWHFHLVAGSFDPENASSLRVGRIEEIIYMLRSVYDYVFIDIGRALSNITLPLIQQADVIAIVLSTELNAVTLTKKVWQYLQAKGISADNIYAILNRAVGLEGLTKSDIESLLNLKIQTTLPYLGGNFALANSQHVPLTLKYPNDTAAMILKEAAGQIITLAKQVRTRAKTGD